MRLKAKEVKDCREKMFKQQKGICLLCKKPMTLREAVLDHCHSTGHVRGVLHSSCNGAEGRIAKAIYRSRADNTYKSLVDFVSNLSIYWSQDYSTNVLHPKHLLPEEKEIKRLKKYQRSLKGAEARQRTQAKIDALKVKVKQQLENK